MRLGRLFFMRHIFFLLVVLFLGFSFFIPRIFATSAPIPGINGDKVGPELAFFDQGSQTGACDKVVKANGFNGTVAVMNPIAGNPYNPCPGPKVNLRIVQITYKTTIPEVVAFADKLNSSSDFPAGTRVIMGVELNNLDDEYWGGGASQGVINAAIKYAELFNAFSNKIDHTKYRVYPAPPDLYNANPSYDPKKWIAAFNRSVNCAKIDALSGDIFDVTPQVPVSVTPPAGLNKNLMAYTYYQQNVCGGSKKVDYFEGWGADPTNPTLREQVDFYLKTQLPPGVEAAATLIKNTCESNPAADRRWFYYLQGRVFDKDGNELNLDSCRKSQKSLYVYTGIEDQVSKDDKLQFASRYMLTCAPRLELLGKVENEDIIDRPTGGNYVSFGLNCPKDSGCLIPQVAGIAFINHEQTTIPLFRMQNAKVPLPDDPKRRTTDLEGFFGASYAPLGETETGKIPLANGVAKKLVPAPTTCEQTIQFLRAVRSLCANEPPSSVPVNNPTSASASASAPSLSRCVLDQDIPLTSYSYLSALSAWESDELSCQSTGNPSPKQQEMQGVLARVENTTPKAFKPAYIVHYINLPREEPTIFEKFQTWFPPDGKTIQDKLNARVSVTKVYVPANFATNSTDAPALPQAGTSANFTGSFMNTMKAFLPSAQIEYIEQAKTNEIAGVLGLSKGGNMLLPDPAGDPEIYTSKFVNCPECTDSDLESILVRRINAEIARGDENVKTETNLACLEGNLAGEKAAERKQTINPDGNPDPVREVGVRAAATLRAKSDPKGPHTDVRTFLLLPEEFRNIYAYEKSFIGTLYAGGQAPAFSEQKLDSGNKNYKYLQLSDTAPKFGRNGLTIHVSSPEQEGGAVGYFVSRGGGGVTEGTGTEEEQTTAQFLRLKGSVSGPDINTFDINPTVPGGRLARGLWEIVCHVTQPFRSEVKATEYTGFERFLKEGPKACFEPPKPSPTVPICKITPEEIACKNFRPGTSSQSWSASAVETETACSPSGGPGGSGQQAIIKSGVVQLALKVSELTCTPAEMLIGVLAKETRGLKDNPGTPLEGIITEISTRDAVREGLCAQSSPDKQDSIYFGTPCGAYQYTQAGISDQIRVYGAPITDCLNALGIGSDRDTRELGVSMCTAAVNLWRGIYCAANSCPNSLRGTYYGCEKKAGDYSSLTEAQKSLALLGFHGNSEADINYLAFIDQYKYLVGRVREQVKSCPGK